MTILHIEHPVTDFDQWAAAFTGFADRRRQGGVRAEHIRRPVDDQHYVLIDLDFDSNEEAAQFLRFLTDQVWASPKLSPALSGRPITRILENVDLTVTIK